MEENLEKDKKAIESKEIQENHKKAFNKEFNELKSKYNLDLKVAIDFPQYRILPVEVRLSLEIIRKHGVSYQVMVVEKNKNDNT